MVKSSGGLVCARVQTARDVPHPATYFGKGKVQELQQQIATQEIDLLVVDHDISPIQERNLERALECRVLSRTGLILDIFAQRATSHEGKLQVELAQLKHLSTRLVRGWTHLERQKGGIGLRGPGETQLETDRQLLGIRIRTLRQRLDKVAKQRQLRRRARKRAPVATVSLVGYTNAGKSTLFNQLTGADVLQEDRLFATLDPTMRRLDLGQIGEVVLSDTVGFIRDLPHTLVDAFHSTLEEVREATLLLHVVDDAAVDAESCIEQVNKVLLEIGADQVPILTVFNKIDLSGHPSGVHLDADGLPAKVWLSAQTQQGLEALRQAVSAWLTRNHRRWLLHTPPQFGQMRAKLYEKGLVTKETELQAGGWELELQLDVPALGLLRSMISGQGLLLLEIESANNGDPSRKTPVLGQPPGEDLVVHQE